MELKSWDMSLVGFMSFNNLVVSYWEVFDYRHVKKIANFCFPGSLKCFERKCQWNFRRAWVAKCISSVFQPHRGFPVRQVRRRVPCKGMGISGCLILWRCQAELTGLLLSTRLVLRSGLLRRPVLVQLSSTDRRSAVRKALLKILVCFSIVTF